MAALRQAVFGEKKSGPPPVLQKSSNKPLQNRKEEKSTPPRLATHHAPAKKSSVLKIAAALESNKSDDDDEEPEAKESVNVHPTKAYPPLVKQKYTKGVDKSVNQPSEDSSFPSGAPYEVPKQGRVRQQASRNNTTHTVSSNHDGNAASQLGRHDTGEAEQIPESEETQSALADSLQAAIARRALKKEKHVARKSDNRDESGNTKLSQYRDKLNPTGGSFTKQSSSPTDNVSQESVQKPLLERIRQRKAQRVNQENDSTGTADVAVHNQRPSVPDTPSNNASQFKPAAEEAEDLSSRPSAGYNSNLRRSSSNLSSRRISDENVPDAENSRNSRRKGLNRSSSVSRRSRDATIPNPTSDSNLSTSNRLQRSPSNRSRRSSEESVPQLPPRSNKTKVVDSFQTADASQRTQHKGRDPIPDTRNTSNVANSRTDTHHDSHNSTSSSAEESMILADFISRYSGALPLAVSVQDSASVSSKRLISTAQCNSFNIHFIKHSKVVILHDEFGGESFSVPLNSSVKFGLIYDQQRATASDHARHFENAGDIMSLKQLPYVICATRKFDGGSEEKSVVAGEILFVRGVKKPKAIGRGKVLKVNSINGDEKILGSKCSAGFTTSPRECQLTLTMMMANSIPFPQQVLIFGEAQVTSYLKKTMINQPVTLEKIHGESSAIMTPRFDTSATNTESWMYDVTTDMKLWVKKHPISKEERDELNANTNVHYTTFDPFYIQHYADKLDDDGIALQHVLFINILHGKEKEGMHLYLPSAGMMPQDLDMSAASETGHETMTNEDSTYAVHITQQRKPTTWRQVEKAAVSIDFEASAEFSDGSSHILPTEELEDEDEPEEAYEEVMTALVNVQEEQPEPTEARKIGKLAGMFKSVKQSLTKMHKDETSHLDPDTAEEDSLIEPASPSPEPGEDYDRVSFDGEVPDQDDHPSQADVPPPLPDTSLITRRKPPQIAPPPPPFEQTTGTPSIALQRLMAAAKISPANTVDEASEQKEKHEQEGYQPVSVDDEMYEEDECGYSDVRSLDIPSIIAARQSSIANTLSKRKPPLPPPSKEGSPGAASLNRGKGSSSSADKAESIDESVQQNSRHSSSGGSVEGDYVRLRGLYTGLQTQMSQMMDEMNHMKARIEELSQMVVELVQAKDNQQDSLHPSKSRTLPRNKKTKIK